MIARVVIGGAAGLSGAMLVLAFEPAATVAYFIGMIVGGIAGIIGVSYS